MSNTIVKKTAKDIESYGDTRGTKVHWRDPRDPLTILRSNGNNNRSKSLPINTDLMNNNRRKAMDIYDKSMEPQYGETKTIVKEVVVMKDYPIDKPVERPTESDKKTRGHKYDFFSGSPTFERKTAADHTTQIIRQSSPVPLNTENRIIRTEKAPEYAKPIVREYSDIPIRANRQPIEPKFREAHRRESFNTPHAKAYEEPEIMEKIEEKPIEELPRILTPKKPIEAKFREREKLDVNKIIYARENDDFIPPKVIQADPPPVLPKIEPKPRRRLLENEDSDDQDHSEFYSWLFNGTHDMNKAKGLLFQKKL